MDNAGWVKSYRKIRDHWIWESAEDLRAWIDLLMEATYEPKKIDAGNGIIKVERGSLLTSKRKLSTRWNWSRSKVDNFLDKLAKDGMITTQPVDYNPKPIMIIILNYNQYQGKKTTPKPPEPQGVKSDFEDPKSHPGTTKRATKKTTPKVTECQGVTPANQTPKKPPKEPPKEPHKKYYKEVSKEATGKSKIYRKPDFLNITNQEYQQLPTKYKKIASRINKEYFKLAENFNKTQAERHPNLVDKVTLKRNLSGADTIRKLIEIDGKDLEYIKKVLRWGIQDEFWQTNIRSAAALRKKNGAEEIKFNNLAAAYERSQASSKNNEPQTLEEMGII